jgi:hypothetical protein
LIARRAPYRLLPLLGSAAAIAIATLRPAPPSKELSLTCVVCGGQGALNLILNVALFVPWGLAWRYAGRSWATALLTGGLASVLIEISQYFALAGRHPTLGDLLANTAGALLGAWVFDRWRRVLWPSRGLAVALAIAWTACLGVLLAGTARLLAPAARSSDFWGQWAPQENREFFPWGGKVKDFTVNAIACPYSFVAETATTKARFGGGTVDARAAVVTGPTTPALSAIARLVDYTQEIVLLGQSDDDLIVRARLRARDATLRQPYVRMPNAIPRSGVSVVVRGGTTRRGWFLDVQNGATSSHREVHFSAGLGWALLLPFDRPLPPLHEGVNAFWLAMLAFPLGLWSAAGPRSLRAALAAIALASLVVVHAVAGFHAPSAPEYGGLLVGIVLGLLARAAGRQGAPPAEQR